MAKTQGKEAKTTAPAKAETSPKTVAAKAPARTESAARSVPGRPPVPAVLAHPLDMFRRLAEEMDHLVADFRTSVFPRFDFQKMEKAWAPPVEVSERGGELVIRAELPGLTKKDVHVEIHDDAITIEGERRQERAEKGKGFYRSERSYGSFFRQIPLPEGTDPASAKATFKDGLLEVSVPAPPKPPKGRGVPIDEG
jgi:HSP20 family protein